MSLGRAPHADVLVSSDFFPLVGGAHRWLYDVYRKWPTPVSAFVTDYASDPERAAAQREFDRLDHGALRIHRTFPAIDDIALFSSRFLRTMIRARARLRACAPSPGRLLHCLRAIPDALVGLTSGWGSTGARGLVTYAHGEEILIAETSRLLNFCTRLTYYRSRLIVANSNATRDLVVRACPRAAVTVAHPGVDVAAFDVRPQSRMELRRAWGAQNETPLLLSLARLEPRKNHAGVLHALAGLRRRGVHFLYVVAGTGENRHGLQQLAQELGLSESVRFIGQVTEEERFVAFAAADVHVMPSIRLGPMTEGFGIVFLEAAAAGTPSVAGNVGGQPEAVRDGVTGLVVDGADNGQIESAIYRLVADHDLRKRMGLAAREWAFAHNLEATSKTIRLKIQEAVRA